MTAPASGKTRRIRRAEFRSSVVAALTVGILSLTGCASPVGLGPDVAPSPSTISAGVPVGSSAFDISCDELAVQADLSALFESGPTLSHENLAGVTGPALYQTAFRQAGGLRCDWGAQYSPPALRVFALPDSARWFDRARSELGRDDFLTLGKYDAAYYNCHHEYPGGVSVLSCVWRVLSGDIWVTVATTGLTDSALSSGTDAPVRGYQLVTASDDSAVTRFVTSIVDKIVHSPRQKLIAAETPVASCAALFNIGELAKELQGDVMLYSDSDAELGVVGYTTADEGDPMGAVSMRKLGYRQCGIGTPPDVVSSRALVTVAPGGSWVFDSTRATSIDGIDKAISECTITQDGPTCTLAVVVGNTLISVETPESSPTIGSVVMKNVLLHLR